jgi:hypothetical protein
MRNVFQRRLNLTETQEESEIDRVVRLAKISTCCVLILAVAYFALLYLLTSR